MWRTQGRYLGHCLVIELKSCQEDGDGLLQFLVVGAADQLPDNKVTGLLRIGAKLIIGNGMRRSETPSDGRPS